MAAEYIHCVMKNKKLEPAIAEFTQLMLDLNARGYHSRNSFATKVTRGKLDRVKINALHFSSGDPFLQCSPNLFDGFDTNLMFVIVADIMRKLKMYNALWECPSPRTSQLRETLAKLVELKIIIRIKGSSFFLVNPDKIWRGNQLLVYTSFLTHLNGRKLSQITSKDICDLQAVATYEVVNSFDNWDKGGYSV